MYKILAITLMLVFTGCSVVDIHQKHSLEKKALRREHPREMDKLKGKQSLEFGALMLDKLGHLKAFFS